MNIHEYQAKEILRQFGIATPKGVAILNLEEITKKIQNLNSKKLVLKAQIHSGGRGKAGGIKIIKNIENLTQEAKKIFGKVLITHQTGSVGRKVKRLYIEETCDIKKEFYLSCLVDRSSSKIAFISSSEGGIDIEDVAKNRSDKIVTVKINLHDSIKNNDVEKIIKPFNLSTKSHKQAYSLVQSIYKILIEKDSNLI